MATTAAIENAIKELRASERPNISEIARKYKIDYMPLYRRFKGKASSKEDYDTKRGLLSQQQD
jgi:hypothetical protein